MKFGFILSLLARKLATFQDRWLQTRDGAELPDCFSHSIIVELVARAQYLNNLMILVISII